ncbi:hypothetical protein [Leptospira ilyithenensis]|uniref:Uncharacterized protein n=1 Tax=Leptospira ilyithenensis TaxID=2484901 RepID=A0A4R9LP04_9LEPT|nr:hypothetical protein [Leptospira ilyithenensis]TGN08477.1 hypothetical protein EHS11_16410 [Leptospira ilyithenensis]
MLEQGIDFRAITDHAKGKNLRIEDELRHQIYPLGSVQHIKRWGFSFFLRKMDSITDKARFQRMHIIKLKNYDALETGKDFLLKEGKEWKKSF